MVTTLHKGISSCCTNKIHVLQAPLWWELKKNATFILIFQYKLYNRYLVNTTNLWYLKQFCHIYIYYIFMINVSPRLVYYMYFQEPSCCWLYGSWIYNYGLPVQSVHITTSDTTLCNDVCQWPATGLWFCPGTPISSPSPL